MTHHDASILAASRVTIGRRRWLAALAGAALIAACAPAAGPLASGTSNVPSATAPAASATASPAASGPLALTPALTEGPYWKAGSPARTSLLETGVVGTKLVLTGRVLTVSGAPVAGAIVDFWQADGNGNYDNSGYRLRGRQTTDAQGNYTLETVIPGLYPGRTEHIHVKVQPPGKSVLTTQLFFPGVQQNSSDGIFRQELVVKLQQTGTTFTAQFDFVVNA